MDDVIQLTSKLIERPSVTPDDAGCQQLIASILTEAGFNCEHLRFGDTDNLWARYGKSEPVFVFAGHTDVVPTGPVEDWTHPPFHPVIKENRLYGRGACDMKGALAAMVLAAKKFVKVNPHLKGSIAFLITSDEEGPGTHGTEKALKTLLDRGDNITYCVIGEPSTEKNVGDQVRVGRRGSLHGKLKIHGKQGHVAHPHLAENAIHRSLAALDALCKSTWDIGNEHFPPTSFQMTNLHSGTGAGNVIPGHCEATFNFRFSTAVTPDELKQQVKKLLEAHHLQFDLEWSIGGLPFLTNQGKLINATQLAIREVTELETRLSTGGGTSDGRFIAPTGAEVVELGVPFATAHQVDENTLVDDLIKLEKIYTQILNHLML